MTTDTLKQAAQALQRAKTAHEFAEMKRPGFGHAQDAKLCDEIAAALEAMAEQKPVGCIEVQGKDAKKGMLVLGVQRSREFFIRAI